MKKILGYTFCLIASLIYQASPAHAVSTFTSCYTLEKPATGDQNNLWGTTENNGKDIADQALAGSTTINVGGGGTIVLTDNTGAISQAKNRVFVLSGTLPNNTTILWPSGRCRDFSVQNNSTGAFTTTLGVNNGSGSPLGTTVVIPQGMTSRFYSDGTNISQSTTGVPGNFTASKFFGDGSNLTNIPAGSPTGPASGDLTGNYPAPNVASTHLTAALPTAQGGTGLVDGSNLVPACSTEIFVGFTPPTGWVFANGQALSRTGAAANLFACSTIQTTGNTHTSTSIDALGSTTNMQVGMPICGPGVPLNTTIASIVNSSSITISNAATASSNGVPLVVAPYGCGDGSTTFNVIDLRGSTPFGLDSMGGIAANRLGNNTSSGGFAGTNFLGQKGGAQAHTQLVAEMASHSHSVSVTSESISPVSNDDLGHGALSGWTWPSIQFISGISATGTVTPSQNGTGCFTGITNVYCWPFLSISASAASNGSSVPANITPPGTTVNYIVKEE